MIYNSNDIQKIIPHRYPFLLVDQITEISEDGLTIIGKKAVSANEMQFMGHFPDKHVMPGVLIIEALASKDDTTKESNIDTRRRAILIRRGKLSYEVAYMTVNMSSSLTSVFF